MSIRTVWSKDALDDIPTRYRPLVKWAYPLIYGINLAVVGVYGFITGGTQTMRDAYPYPGASLLCAAIGVSALVALIGVVFQLQQLERTGDGLLVAGTVTYLLLLVLALGDGQGSSPVFTISLDVGFTVLAFFRIQDLSRDIGRKKKAKAVT